MPKRLLLLTPPFTQLNTPYPATAYIKGFLNTLHVESRQVDMGIEVFSKLFTKKNLQLIFSELDSKLNLLDENSRRLIELKDQYLSCIDSVISFMRGQNNTLAYQISDRKFLPEGKRFEGLEDLDYYFGTLGIIDKAKHLCTLFLEDIGDVITQYSDPYFGFNRYAESIARAASDFDQIIDSLEAPQTMVTQINNDILLNIIQQYQPTLVCISVPFPGNLFGALISGQFIKQNFPQIKIAMGGGFVNTELRSIYDERFFDYTDFLSLDDGEMPLKCIIEYMDGKRSVEKLKRTFLLKEKNVTYIDGAPERDIAQRETGTPDYRDLDFTKYVSILEVNNPMHRLWSDGRWNKLTLAHGCYWGKCSFCDISLDYIARYEPTTAALICDRIEQIIDQTGQNGFHFVDEAAPPALMTDLAIELIRRGICISWWTNIRFEKSFTKNICRLLKQSGCIAVSGGLEVASDRLLSMMKKGVTIEQVSKVAHAFSQAGIMVHAYLMYGFPTETDQETIDSLEVVRQMFESGIIQSGFWHRFAMTAHSPVGLNPAEYHVAKTGPVFSGFAENDLYHEDKQGANHDLYSEGLRISLYNYMNGAGFDLALQKWFDHKIPNTTHPKNLIVKHMNSGYEKIRLNARVFFLGNVPKFKTINEEYSSLIFFEKNQNTEVELPNKDAAWLMKILPKIMIVSEGILLDEFIQSFAESESLYDVNDIESFLDTELGEMMLTLGLIVV